jgi:hypothetical protein
MGGGAVQIWAKAVSVRTVLHHCAKNMSLQLTHRDL